jgi:hypothetical protein
MKVAATEMSMRLGTPIDELHRIANPGEIFEVSTTRFKYLSGGNPHHIVYVVEADDKVEPEVKQEVVEETTEEVVEEVKPKRTKKHAED